MLHTTHRMNICENSSSWERYVIHMSFSSSHTNKIRQDCLMFSGFFVFGVLLIFWKKSWLYVKVSWSQMAFFFLCSHPSKSWKKRSSVLHHPTIQMFQLEKLLCAHICQWEALKEFVYLATYHTAVNMLEAGRCEEQWGVFKNVLRQKWRGSLCLRKLSYKIFNCTSAAYFTPGGQSFARYF